MTSNGRQATAPLPAPYSLSAAGAAMAGLGETVLTKVPTVRPHFWDRTPMAPEKVVPCSTQLPALCFVPTALHELRRVLLHQRVQRKQQHQLQRARLATPLSSAAAHAQLAANGARVSELPPVAARLRAEVQITTQPGDTPAAINLIVTECVAAPTAGADTASAYSSAQRSADRATGAGVGTGSAARQPHSELWIDVFRYAKRRPSPAASLNQSKEQQMEAIRRSWQSFGGALGGVAAPATAAADDDDDDDDSDGDDGDAVAGVRMVGAAECVFNTAQYVSFMQQQKATREAHGRDDGSAALSQYLLVRCVAAPHSPTLSLSLRGEVIVPSYSLRFQLIKPVPMQNSRLAQALENHSYRPPDDGSSAYGAGAGLATGFITFDQFRQAMPLEATNAFGYQKPFSGVWFYGVDRVDHPYVWAHCLRFMFSASILDRVTEARHTFLVLFFNPAARNHSFFECSFDGSAPKFAHFEFGQDIQLREASAPRRTPHPTSAAAFAGSSVGSSGSSGSGSGSGRDEGVYWLQCQNVADRTLNRKFRHAEKLLHELDAQQLPHTHLHQPLITSPEKEDDATAATATSTATDSGSGAGRFPRAVTGPVPPPNPFVSPARSAGDAKYPAGGSSSSSVFSSSTGSSGAVVTATPRRGAAADTDAVASRLPPPSPAQSEAVPSPLRAAPPAPHPHPLPTVTSPLRPDAMLLPPRTPAPLLPPFGVAPGQNAHFPIPGMALQYAPPPVGASQASPPQSVPHGIAPAVAPSAAAFHAPPPIVSMIGAHSYPAPYDRHHLMQLYELWYRQQMSQFASHFPQPHAQSQVPGAGVGIGRAGSSSDVPLWQSGMPLPPLPPQLLSWLLAFGPAGAASAPAGVMGAGLSGAAPPPTAGGGIDPTYAGASLWQQMLWQSWMADHTRAEQLRVQQQNAVAAAAAASAAASASASAQPQKPATAQTKPQTVASAPTAAPAVGIAQHSPAMESPLKSPLLSAVPSPASPGSGTPSDLSPAPASADLSPDDAAAADPVAAARAANLDRSTGSRGTAFGSPKAMARAAAQAIQSAGTGVGSGRGSGNGAAPHSPESDDPTPPSEDDAMQQRVRPDFKAPLQPPRASETPQKPRAAPGASAATSAAATTPQQTRAQPQAQTHAQARVQSRGSPDSDSSNGMSISSDEDGMQLSPPRDLPPPPQPQPQPSRASRQPTGPLSSIDSKRALAPVDRSVDTLALSPPRRSAAIDLDDTDRLSQQPLPGRAYGAAAGTRSGGSAGAATGTVTGAGMSVFGRVDAAADGDDSGANSRADSDADSPRRQAVRESVVVTAEDEYAGLSDAMRRFLQKMGPVGAPAPAPAATASAGSKATASAGGSAAPRYDAADEDDGVVVSPPRSRAHTQSHAYSAHSTHSAHGEVDISLDEADSESLSGVVVTGAPNSLMATPVRAPALAGASAGRGVGVGGSGARSGGRGGAAERLASLASSMAISGAADSPSVTASLTSASLAALSASLSAAVSGSSGGAALDPNASYSSLRFSTASLVGRDRYTPATGVAGGGEPLDAAKATGPRTKRAPS